MKKLLILCFLLSGYAMAIAQSAGNYPGDVDKAAGLIKNGAYKRGYKYVITFANTNQAAIFVKPNTGYAIFFVYDNTTHPAADFTVSLMTPDSALQKKYTTKPFDRAQVGVARVQQLTFQTPKFTGDTRPVKMLAKPNATIYVFDKK
jgi:hypothetical protein